MIIIIIIIIITVKAATPLRPFSIDYEDFAHRLQVKFGTLTLFFLSN